jgi:hypothetical protein
MMSSKKFRAVRSAAESRTYTSGWMTQTKRAVKYATTNPEVLNLTRSCIYAGAFSEQLSNISRPFFKLLNQIVTLYKEEKT